MSESYELISAKEHYLNQPVVRDFCQYLAGYLAGRPFTRCYTTETLKPKVCYCFTSLEDACEQFYWETSNVVFFEALESLRVPLLNALDNGSGKEILRCIQERLPEKKIVTNNWQWMVAHENSLCDLFPYACEELQSANPNVNLFGRPYGPRMSAFLSRLYTVIAPQMLSYDSRIAATLTLFVREFCVTHKLELPHELTFVRLQGWGKTKRATERDASWGDNAFPCLDAIKKAPQKESAHAKSMIYASWALNEALRLALSEQNAATRWLAGDGPMRRIEAAFFMMGARLPTFEPNSPTF